MAALPVKFWKVILMEERKPRLSLLFIKSPVELDSHRGIKSTNTFTKILHFSNCFHLTLKILWKKYGYFLSTSLHEGLVTAFHKPTTVLMLETQPWARPSPAFRAHRLRDMPLHWMVPGGPHPRANQVSKRKRCQVVVQSLNSERWKVEGLQRLNKLAKVKQSARKQQGRQTNSRFIVCQLCAMAHYRSSWDVIWFNAQWPSGQ